MTVIIGLDPHKRSHTAVARGIDDEVLGELRVAADTRQISKLMRFAKPWPDRVWAWRTPTVSDGCWPGSSSRRVRL